MTMRKMVSADIPDVAEAEKVIFTDPWSAEAIRGSFEMPGTDCRVIVADDESDLAGYYFALTVAGESELLNIGVLPRFRRCGYGRTMLRRALENAAKLGSEGMWLEVRVSNTPARSLYESEGFAAVGIRKNYYPLPGGGREDAVLMKKEF